MGYLVKNRRLKSGSSGVVLPAGPTSQRPLAPVFGLIRYNTDAAAVEYFDGIQFVELATSAGLTYTVDLFTGDGTTTVFTMSVLQAQATQVIVFVGSIYQTPVTAYSVDGGFDITFSSAPPADEPISVIHTGF